MIIYDLKDTTPADIPGLVIDGIAHVLAYSKKTGTFPAQYSVNPAYLNSDHAVFIDAETGEEISSVSRWCEYPALGG